MRESDQIQNYGHIAALKKPATFHRTNDERRKTEIPKTRNFCAEPQTTDNQKRSINRELINNKMVMAFSLGYDDLMV